MKIENITLRDWFAAQAINGLIQVEIESSKYELTDESNFNVAKAYDDNGNVVLAIPDVCNLCPDKDGYQELAEAAYALSDAMLLARK
jgi:hypothetical protein